VIFGQTGCEKKKICQNTNHLYRCSAHHIQKLSKTDPKKLLRRLWAFSNLQNCFWLNNTPSAVFTTDEKSIYIVDKVQG